jgi:transcriptional regulator with XRE-family HTH domain
MFVGVPIGMPATRQQRLYNPLRKLRVILGELGQPLHQESFASRIGVSVATVRAIESGRRPMTQDNCLDQILLTLQATWNPRDEQWHVLGSKWLYEKKHADVARELYHDDAYTEDLSVHYLLERILSMFAATNEPQKRITLLSYLNNTLKDAVQHFGLQVESMALTEPIWTQSNFPTVWGKELPKPVVWWPYYLEAPRRQRPDPGPHQDDGGIYDFRAWRKFNAADYPARSREEAEQLFEQARTRRKEKREGKVERNERTKSAPESRELEREGENEQRGVQISGSSV